MAEEDKTPEVEGEGGAEAAEAEEGPSALDDLHAAATEHAANLHAAASEAIGEHVAYVSSMFGGSGEEGGDVVVAGDEIDVPDFTPFEIEAVKLGDLEVRFFRSCFRFILVPIVFRRHLLSVLRVRRHARLVIVAKKAWRGGRGMRLSLAAEVGHPWGDRAPIT